MLGVTPADISTDLLHQTHPVGGEIAWTRLGQRCLFTIWIFWGLCTHYALWEFSQKELTGDADTRGREPARTAQGTARLRELETGIHALQVAWGRGYSSPAVKAG